MKISIISTTFLLSAVSSVAAAREKKQAQQKGNPSRQLESEFTRVLGGGLREQKRSGRDLSGKGNGKSRGICDDCDEDFDVYYHYDPASSFYDALTRAPSDCTLAAIRDMDSYYGALFAIPTGRRALIQGVLDIDDFLDNCELDDDMVADCEEDYNELGWENLDESDVPTDDDIWSDVDYPLPTGQLNLALGSDGLLYPVASWNNSAFDGGVYECCPQIDDVCNEFVVEEATVTVP